MLLKEEALLSTVHNWLEIMEEALLSTVHNWLEMMESGREICVIFLDYKKVFDSVPHGPLIIKLRSIGLCDTLIIWLSDYLSHRKQ